MNYRKSIEAIKAISVVRKPSYDPIFKPVEFDGFKIDLQEFVLLWHRKKIGLTRLALRLCGKNLSAGAGLITKITVLLSLDFYPARPHHYR